MLVPQRKGRHLRARRLTIHGHSKRLRSDAESDACDVCSMRGPPHLRARAQRRVQTHEQRVALLHRCSMEVRRRAIIQHHSLDAPPVAQPVPHCPRHAQVRMHLAALFELGRRRDKRHASTRCALTRRPSQRSSQRESCTERRVSEEPTQPCRHRTMTRGCPWPSERPKMVYPKLCQSTTTRDRSHQLATHTTASVGMVGGFWIKMRLGRGIRTSSVHSSQSVCGEAGRVGRRREQCARARQRTCLPQDFEGRVQQKQPPWERWE